MTTFHAPDGTLRVSAGEAVGSDAQPTDPTAVLDPGDDGTLEVSVIEVGLERNDPEAPAQGVRVDVPGSEVARWGPFEAAYMTDGGMGAVMTQAGHDRSASIDPDTVIDALVDDGSLVLRPSNDAPDDVFVFGNSWGDGAFPMSVGVDADGRSVALLIWHTSYPWRLAVPDGAPPPDVTRQEDQLQECLDGTRDLVAQPYQTDGKTKLGPLRCDVDE